MEPQAGLLRNQIYAVDLYEYEEHTNELVKVSSSEDKMDD